MTCDAYSGFCPPDTATSTVTATTKTLPYTGGLVNGDIILASLAIIILGIILVMLAKRRRVC